MKCRVCHAMFFAEPTNSPCQQSSFPFIQVVSAACQATNALHNVEPRIGSMMTQTAHLYLERIREHVKQGFPPQYTGITKRCLITLGHIIKHGSKVLEGQINSNEQACLYMNTHCPSLCFWMDSYAGFLQRLRLSQQCFFSLLVP